MVKRFKEIDFLRGIAIILMVVFHMGYNLNFFELMNLDVWTGGWLFIARIVQFIFVISTGLTLFIAYERRMGQGRDSAAGSRFIHAGKIFGWGMVITAVTWLLFKEQAVKFGILHFYGASMILSLPLLRLRAWNSLVGAVILLATIPLQTLSIENPWLFPLGLIQPSFQSLDYFPLFPWFGLFLQGIAIGALFYKKQTRQFKFPFTLSKQISKPLEYMGRRSLLIYLIHQPLIVGLIQIWIVSKR